METLIYKQGEKEPIITNLTREDAEQLILDAARLALNNTRWADRPPYVEHLIYAVRDSHIYAIYEDAMAADSFYYHELAKRYEVLAIHRNINTK